MLALYIITVVGGCSLPFLSEKNKKDRIITCILMLIDLMLIAAMAFSDIAYLQYLGKEESIAVAGCLMLLSIAIKKIHELTNNQHVTKGVPKTHHQTMQNQNNHKAAS